MSIRQDYIEAINDFVLDDNIKNDEKRKAIDMAIKKYSKDKPKIRVQDITGDSGFEYAVSALTYWADDFSVIKTIEYPVDDDDETPDILLDEEWMVYEKTTGKVIRFLEDEPNTDESFRVTYTALHVCSDSTCTISSIDENAVQALAASFCCEMLAVKYTPIGDSTIDADSVDHKSKASEYARRAKGLKQIYLEHMGIKEGQSPPVSINYDWDINPSWGTDRATHPRKHR